MMLIEEIEILIKKLESSPNYIQDLALQEIFNIFKEINSEKELKKQTSLINRMTLDCVENWEDINIIGDFLHKFN